MLIAFDLDGTLHPSCGDNEAESLGKLADYLSSRSIFTVLATGRSLNKTLELTQIIERLPIDGIVANSGSQVYLRKNGVFILDRNFSVNPSSTIPQKDRGEICQFFLRSASVWCQESKHQFPGKLSFYIDVEAISTIRKMIVDARVLFPNFEYLISYNNQDRCYHYLDVLTQSATKLAGLRHIALTVGIMEKDILYFGDNGNDLPCIRAFERSVMIKTHLDNLQKDTKDFDWNRVLKLQNSGANSILAALKEIN
jgi:HAD superfamily hydrolase (TIGR01484 family)